ncbi:MAG: LEA type 2 family protein [Candidatus Eisenbacteria bacterium]|nr:LEA type 2 family protein [Candidatus Eisenbacteria bacterium]
MIRKPRAALAPAFLLMCLLAVTSCSQIEEPTVTMTGVDFRGISTEGLAFRLLLDVENPNGFGADIGELEYRVLLDNVEVATGLQEDSVAVPAESIVEVGIPFIIVWSGIGDGLQKLLDGEEHEWRLKGSVRLNKGAMSRVFRFSENGKFDAPRANDIDVDLDL